jgi:ubiquinol-cytochrome c reductase cytochrome b subunit
MSRGALAIFVISFLVLMYLGLQPAEGLYVLLARIFTLLYFLYFLAMPIYTRLDPVKPVPQRLTGHAH